MLTAHPGVSVIVCCYNSSARLSETLKHLAGQIVPNDIGWEVILVNNASTDDTAQIAETEWAKYETGEERLRIINEPIPGLSYARQKGAKNAQFKYIIFCDDDNWLDRNYLMNAYKIMESNLKIGALGGKSTAVTDDIKFPDWFQSLQHGFAVGTQSPYEGDISKTGVLWGAGMVTRTELFLNCYSSNYPSILVGRKGNELSSGEDTEYCLRLLLQGYKLYYDEKLIFVHFISKSRWSAEYFTRLTEAKKKGIYDAMELNKYALLYKLSNTSTGFKPFLVFKTFLGYLSSLLLSRRSWSLADVKTILYYYARIDLGVDHNTKLIFSFHRNHSLKTSHITKAQ